MTNRKNPAVAIHQNREAMGVAAARSFQQRVEQVLSSQPRCRVIFGCAPSQDDFLRALVQEARHAPSIWRQVEVFHMDEYVGLPASHPQSFRAYLRQAFLQHISTASFQAIRGEAASAENEAMRYATLLGAGPIDVIAMGIGENGHVAFNDPPVADFNDPRLAKIVELDSTCRQQQVNDGCFPEISLVPRQAITITLPVFARAGSLHCIVPGPRKTLAVRNALLDPVSPACPATILRTHPRSELFLDQASAALYLADKPR